MRSRIVSLRRPPLGLVMPRRSSFRQQRLRRRPRVAVNRVLDRHLVFRRLNIDLRDHGAGSD